MARTCPVCKEPVSPQDAVCPSCGFRLRGATEAMDPLKLQPDGAPPTRPPAQARQASLTVLKGPQVGVRIDLPDDAAEPLVVGRSPRCAVFLNDMTVSREHATLEPGPAGWVLTDQNSFNGTWINNKSIKSTILKNGDIIQIGAFCLRVDC